MTALHRFLHDTRGSVTIEFVIIFPFVIMLILFILFASTLIATASDVQQLAYELARESVGTAGESEESTCVALEQRVKVLAATTAMLSPTNVKDKLVCTLNADGYLTVKVDYNIAGSSIANFADKIGLKGTITRSAKIRP